MTQRFTLEQIRDYWSQQAQAHGTSPAASWADQRVIELEIREILKYLRDGDRVLDIGCANGYSTVQFAAQRALSIRGLDYIPEMIANARQRIAGLPAPIRERVGFDVGDITRLPERDSSYDKVIVVRVLINLGAWENQLQALRECARVVRPGGTLLLSEATLQGWTSLNRFRREWGLPDIPMPAFNLYLDQERLIEAAAPALRLEAVSDFASSYYVGTRVLKPLLIKSLGMDIDVADPNMEWNRWMGQLPAAGDYGTQKLFVFRKQ